jgi:hypothetical protein
MTLAILFGLLVLFIALSVPIAIALAAVAVIAMVLTSGTTDLPNIGLILFDGATGFALITIPLFILAGAIMNACGISRRLIALGVDPQHHPRQHRQPPELRGQGGGGQVDPDPACVSHSVRSGHGGEGDDRRAHRVVRSEGGGGGRRLHRRRLGQLAAPGEDGAVGGEHGDAPSRRRQRKELESPEVVASLRQPGGGAFRQRQGLASALVRQQPDAVAVREQGEDGQRDHQQEGDRKQDRDLPAQADPTAGPPVGDALAPLAAHGPRRPGPKAASR